MVVKITYHLSINLNIFRTIVHCRKPSTLLKSEDTWTFLLFYDSNMKVSFPNTFECYRNTLRFLSHQSRPSNACPRPQTRSYTIYPLKCVLRVYVLRYWLQSGAHYLIFKLLEVWKLSIYITNSIQINCISNTAFLELGPFLNIQLALIGWKMCTQLCLNISNLTSTTPTEW